MNDEEFKRLQKLDQLFIYSELICDPLEYIQRKKSLLHGVLKFILEPYHEELKRRSQNQVETVDDNKRAE